VLGGLFIVLSIAMAAIAGATRQPTKIDTSLSNVVAPDEQKPQQPVQQQQQAPAVPLAQ
jgi:preprotein translocase subunit SecG